MSSSTTTTRRPPLTLLIGVALLLAFHTLQLIDIQHRHGAIVPYTPVRDLPTPQGPLQQTARYVAGNMTPLCWAAYLLLFDGLLAWRARRRDNPALSPIRARPNRFITAWLTSVPVWCFFDTLNFYGLDAWRYHGLNSFGFQYRVFGYLIAFAAISPGMFLAAELFRQLGLRRLSLTDPRRIKLASWFAVLGVPLIIATITLALCWVNRSDLGGLKGVAGAAVLLLGPGLASLARNRTRLATALGFGLGFTLWAILIRNPIGAMTLWVGLVYLLDPLVAKIDPVTRRPHHGAPHPHAGLHGVSLLRDWEQGRWSRTFALMLGGAFCGLLWELWNYWAVAKWTYHLSFMGPLQHVRYFEMPLPGFLGFLPFAAECWVALNLIIVVLERVKLNVAEKLPDGGVI